MQTFRMSSFQARGSVGKERRPAARGRCVTVRAAGGNEKRSRKVKGKCFVTKDVSVTISSWPCWWEGSLG